MNVTGLWHHQCWYATHSLVFCVLEHSSCETMCSIPSTWACLEVVLLFDVHEGSGGVDVFATIKGPALPAFLLRQ